MRSGRAFTHLIEFASGFPDAAVSWALSDTAGNEITTGTVTPAAGALSAVLSISGSHNTLTGDDLVGGRELSWTYTSGGLSYGGEVRYTIEGPVPFPVTNQGVRDKLGIEQHELPDDAIDLMDAYLEYRATVAVDNFITGTSREQRLATNAIEALAALDILPTLQLRLAASEGSGTNTFSRLSKIDWEALASHLAGYVSACSIALSAGAAAGTGLFLAVGPDTDPITGA